MGISQSVPTDIKYAAIPIFKYSVKMSTFFPPHPNFANICMLHIKSLLVTTAVQMMFIQLCAS